MAREQSSRIKDALINHGVPVQIEESADGALLFMCHSSQILVRQDRLETVRRMLRQRPNRRAVTRVTDGVVALTLNLMRLPRAIPRDVVAVVAAIDQAFGQQGIATPDHVMTVCGGVLSPCPATEPEPPRDTMPFPAPCDDGGADVLIYIADTGLVAEALEHEWMKQGVEPAKNPDGTGDWDPAVTGAGEMRRIGLYGGHGSFVAGVVRCIAPKARVIVSNVFGHEGSALESDFVRDLDNALKLGAGIFNVTVSAPTRNDLPLIGFQRWLSKLDRHGKAVCVSPAGNSRTTSPSWPAAFPGPQVVAVGALNSDWTGRAEFSNYGSWVDVYAPGENLVNAFASGIYAYHDPPAEGETAKFSGMAMWSGTSFAAPIVTGLIARRMAAERESGQDAATTLVSNAAKVKNIGAVLLPSCT
jgi:hypothetical protein